MIMLALYRGKSFFPSRCIRWFSWSHYSHAAIVQERLDGQTIIEAWTPGGVQETQRFSQLHARGTRIDLFRFRRELSAFEECALLDFARKQLGRPYDWRGVLSFLFRARMQRKGSWFCSELVAYCCRMIGRQLLMCEDWKVAPGDIAKSPDLVFDSAVYV